MILIDRGLDQKLSLLVILRIQTQRIGDKGEEETPVPIPNTVVKLFSADGTWLETAWESRTSPVKNDSDFQSGSFFMPA